MIIMKKMNVYFLVFMFLFGIAFVNNAQEKETKDTSEKITETFQTTAKNLSLDLMKKINLTLDQTTEVKDILVEYQRDLQDELYAKYEDEKSFEDDEKELTGERKEDREKEKAMVEYEKDFIEIDKSANENIEDIIGEKKVNEYVKVKKDWWSKIKSNIFDKPVITEKEMEAREDAEDGEINLEEEEEELIGANEEHPYETEFNTFAKEMATDLMNKIDISLQQAADVKNALVEYQKNIMEKRQSAEKERMDLAEERRENEADDVNVLENEEDENLVGFEKKVSDIEKSVNEDIVGVLTDSQKPEYEKIKDSWWDKVKTETNKSADKAVRMERNRDKE